MEICHGTTRAYRVHKCRCDDCRAANAEAARRHRSNRRARGSVYRRKDRDYSPLRPCAMCGEETWAKGPVPLCKPCGMHTRRSVCISDARRQALYERDAWICGFCHETVSPNEGANSPWQATLDHITPRSLGGSDAETNLRLVHRYCNSVRSNRMALTLDELVA